MLLLDIGWVLISFSKATELAGLYNADSMMYDASCRVSLLVDNKLYCLATEADMSSKGKEEYLYSAILADTPLTKRSHMDHTVLPANYTMSAFPS